MPHEGIDLFSASPRWPLPAWSSYGSSLFNTLIVRVPVQRRGGSQVKSLQASMDNCFVRHVGGLKTAIRVVFGIVWGIDGALKFQPGVAQSLSGMISDAAQGQPDWLAPWFNFWSQAVSANPAFFTTTIGLFELALAFALLAGFLRKIAYTGGIILSLVIWSVPEGFGGPYGPSSHRHRDGNHLRVRLPPSDARERNVRSQPYLARLCYRNE